MNLINKLKLSIYFAVCSHTTAAYCQICWNLKNQAIINCHHVWTKFSDPSIVGVACDFNLPQHVAATVAHAHVYTCHICHAVSCASCCMG
jgi:hypothetical protein